MTTEEDDPQIESSPLCRTVTRDEITLRVEIYRLAGSGEGWSLEVVDQDGTSTVWDDTTASKMIIRIGDLGGAGGMFTHG
jgi:hypothetical protein